MDSLNILGMKIRVVFREPENEEEELLAGCFEYAKRLITIFVDDPELQKSVLVHEIIEAINCMLELELPHNQITSLETALYGLLENNPELGELFRDREREEVKLI